MSTEHYTQGEIEDSRASVVTDLVSMLRLADYPAKSRMSQYVDVARWNAYVMSAGGLRSATRAVWPDVVKSANLPTPSQKHGEMIADLIANFAIIPVAPMAWLANEES